MWPAGKERLQGRPPCRESPPTPEASGAAISVQLPGPVLSSLWDGSLSKTQQGQNLSPQFRVREGKSRPPPAPRSVSELHSQRGPTTLPRRLLSRSTPAFVPFGQGHVAFDQRVDSPRPCDSLATESPQCMKTPPGLEVRPLMETPGKAARGVNAHLRERAPLSKTGSCGRRGRHFTSKYGVRPEWSPRLRTELPKEPGWASVPGPGLPAGAAQGRWRPGGHCGGWTGAWSSAPGCTPDSAAPTSRELPFPAQRCGRTGARLSWEPRCCLTPPRPSPPWKS